MNTSSNISGLNSIQADFTYNLDSNFFIIRSEKNREISRREAIHQSLFTMYDFDVNGEEILSVLIKNKSWKGVCRQSSKHYFIQIVPDSENNYLALFCEIPEIYSLKSNEDKFALSSPGSLPVALWRSASIRKESNVLFSSGIQQLTGYTLKEFEESSGKFNTLLYYEDVQHSLKILTDFEKNLNQKNIELIYRIVTKEGVIRWVKEEIAKFKDPVSKKVLYLGCIVSIESLKETEQKLRDSEAQLIELNHSKDRFINILSHDLRAPFTSILGFSEILLNEQNLSTEEKTEYLNYIYDAAQNQLQFINYLLDWSRLRIGSLKIEPQRIRVQAIIYNSISVLTGNAIRKNLSIEVDVNENLYVQADERLLTQALLNLLSNAIKFSFENNKIEITANIFNTRQVEFVIRDYGMGIPLEDQSRIFSIEKTFSRDGTKGERGSGFGLALVKEIINKHGGEIWFYSEPEKGSEFHFTIPLPSNTILVVENNVEEREYVLELLAGEFPEFVVYTAENGYEAIGMIANQIPNLIITSHSLPLMNGIQLMEALKRSDSNLKIPVVILSDIISSEFEANYLKAGAAAFIKKPFNKFDFIQSLKLVLN